MWGSGRDSHVVSLKGSGPSGARRQTSGADLFFHALLWLPSGMAPGRRILLTKRWADLGMGILSIMRGISFKNLIGMGLLMWLMAQKNCNLEV